jgi:hypothetical protein
VGEQPDRGGRRRERGRAERGQRRRPGARAEHGRRARLGGAQARPRRRIDVGDVAEGGERGPLGGHERRVAGQPGEQGAGRAGATRRGRQPEALGERRVHQLERPRGQGRRAEAGEPLREPGRARERHRHRRVDLGQGAQAHADLGECAERPPRAGDEPHQVEAGHVLHHAPAGAHHVAGAGHELGAEHEVARQAEGMGERPGGRRGDGRAQRAGVGARRVEREELSFGARGLGDHGRAGCRRGR